MPSDWTRWLVTFAFGMHGLGMLGAGLYLPFAIRAKGFIGGSWLLDRLAYPWATSIVGLVVWVAAGKFATGSQIFAEHVVLPAGLQL